jgi:hypothetical protein
MRIGDILPHPLNPRTHPASQIEPLRGHVEETGITRAVTAYYSERNGGKLTFQDGHGRQSLNPDEFWTVNITDLTDVEADLDLAIGDPLAALAGTDTAKMETLLGGVSTANAAMQQMLDNLATEAGIVPSEQDDHIAGHRVGGGYDFSEVHAGKLAHRVEAAWRADQGVALDLFSGQGQLAWWYARRFDHVIRIDAESYEGITHVCSAENYITSDDFDSIVDTFTFADFDDEGSPLKAVKLFLDRLPIERTHPFVLCITDGSGLNLKLHGMFNPALYGLTGNTRRATTNDYNNLESLVGNAVVSFADATGWNATQWSSARGSENNVCYQTFLIERKC